jgi:hypothetical protein
MDNFVHNAANKTSEFLQYVVVLDLEIEEWKTPQKKIMLFRFIQTKEEDSKETSDKHSKMKSLHQTQVIIREEMFKKFNALDVTNMGTMQEIVQPRRREENMLLLLTLIHIHLKRIKIRERRSTYSKLNITTNLDKSIDL